MTAVRSLLFSIVYFLGTLCLTLVAAAVSWVAPHRLLAIARVWARFVLWSARALCGIQVEVTGRENLPDGGVIVASRHQSAFDTMVWFTLVPDCTYVMKHELLRIPLLGPAMRRAGMIAVDRNAGAKAIRALLKEGRRAAEAGKQIVIFPEGTRAAPGTLLPLQPGVAALAAGTGLPVVPVVTDSGLMWGRSALRKRAGTIHIVIRPPLPTGLSRDVLMQSLQREFKSETPNPG